MKPPQQYTSAEIKMIDRALKKDWKREKRIARIIIVLFIIITLVIVLQYPFDLNNLHQAAPMFFLVATWIMILESYKFFELIKKLAISNVDNDPQKP